MAAFVPLLVLGGVTGLVVWLAVASMRRRRIGWVVASGLVSVFVGALALGLLIVGYGVGCALAVGCSKEFFASVFSSPLATSWFAASAGLVVFGVVLCVYAIYLNVNNLREGRSTRPAFLR